MSSERREEIIGNCRLILGDCFDVLPSLGKIDAVVTDPPYGIGYAHGVGGGKGGADSLSFKRNTAQIIGDDSPFDPTPWLQWPCILWGANHFAQRLPHGRWLAWNKLGHKEPWDDHSDVEFAWQNTRAADRIFSLLWKGIAKGERTTFPGRGHGARLHPNQKPEALMVWCIEHLHVAADVILDPFMGSGTTGVACVKLGRKFVGIEIDPKHFEIACTRIRAAVEQRELFRSAS